MKASRDWPRDADGEAQRRIESSCFPREPSNFKGPEGQILERCDGKRTFGEIIAELLSEFGKTDPEKIRSDISLFLEQLQKKRIVDY